MSRKFPIFNTWFSLYSCVWIPRPKRSGYPEAGYRDHNVFWGFWVKIQCSIAKLHMVKFIWYSGSIAKNNYVPFSKIFFLIISQATHSLDAARLIEIDLKGCLLGLTKELFGQGKFLFMLSFINFSINWSNIDVYTVNETDQQSKENYSWTGGIGSYCPTW